MGLPFFIGISVLVQAIVEEKHLRNLTRGIKKKRQSRLTTYLLTLKSNTMKKSQCKYVAFF